MGISPASPQPDDACSRDWRTFYDAVEGKPARETLLKALELFERSVPLIASADARERFAVDLGCGEGRDTRELLRRGWRVLAIDSSADAIARVEARTAREDLPRLTTRHASYETTEWPMADLINASFSIPHCTRGAFPRIWRAIASALRPRGRFAGQFFGPRDGWMAPRQDLAGGEPLPGEPLPEDGWRAGRQFHSRAQVEQLLAEAHLTPEHFEEVERPGQTAEGEAKYWHVFHVVARRDGPFG